MAHLFQQSIATLADNSLHSTCITMLTVNGWNLWLNFAPYSSVPFVVSRTMSSFNPLSFTLAYHILHTYGLSIIVKVCAHAACSPPGRVHVPLLVSYYVQDEMAYTRYFALWIQLPPTPQSPFSFHLGCGYAR